MDNKILKIKLTIKKLEELIEWLNGFAEEYSQRVDTKDIEALIEYWEAELLKI